MRFKNWWREWESERQSVLGAIIVILFFLLCVWICHVSGREGLQDDLLKDGYNIASDYSKLAGDGRYTIQIWYDGQWNDVLRCGEWGKRNENTNDPKSQYGTFLLSLRRKLGNAEGRSDGASSRY